MRRLKTGNSRRTQESVKKGKGKERIKSCDTKGSLTQSLAKAFAYF
jgi:hypothetical protein